jgi:hypothetical protein
VAAEQVFCHLKVAPQEFAQSALHIYGFRPSRHLAYLLFIPLPLCGQGWHLYDLRPKAIDETA